MTDEAYKGLEKRVAVLETRNAVDEVHRLNVTSKLGEIEDTLKWLTRLILGGLVMAVVGYLVQGGFSL